MLRESLEFCGGVLEDIFVIQGLTIHKVDRKPLPCEDGWKGDVS